MFFNLSTPDAEQAQLMRELLDDRHFNLWQQGQALAARTRVNLRSQIFGFADWVKKHEQRAAAQRTPAPSPAPAALLDGFDTYHPTTTPKRSSLMSNSSPKQSQQSETTEAPEAGDYTAAELAVAKATGRTPAQVRAAVAEDAGGQIHSRRA